MARITFSETQAQILLDLVNVKLRGSWMKMNGLATDVRSGQRLTDAESYEDWASEWGAAQADNVELTDIRMKLVR